MVGQNRIYTSHMTVCMVILLPKTPYIHRIYMVLANPTDELLEVQSDEVNVEGVARGMWSIHSVIRFS